MWTYRTLLLYLCRIVLFFFVCLIKSFKGYLKICIVEMKFYYVCFDIFMLWCATVMLRDISETPCSFCVCLQPLLKSPGASQSCFLGVTALLHRFCSAYNSCDGAPAVQSVMRTLGKFLRGNCAVQDSEERRKVSVIENRIFNWHLLLKKYFCVFCWWSA